MSYPVTVGGVVELSVVGGFNGQTLLNIMHYRFSGGTAITSGAAALISFLAAVNTKFTTAFVNCVGADYQLFAYRGQWIFPTRYRPIVLNLSSVVGAGSPAGTANIGGAITRFGDPANRAALGTWHMPCVPQDQYASGTLFSSQITAYTTLAALMDDQITTALSSNFDPIIYHRANPTASVVVTGAYPQTTVRTSRRRTVGVGQ
jgi:hypothetical protein